MFDEETLYSKADELSDQGDHDTAFKLFMEGALRRYAASMARVATMYFHGEGIQLDWDKSIEWDSKAIALGEDISLGNLAITYRAKGDIRKAKYWFEKSLATGNGDASLQLAKLYMVSDKERETISEYLEQAISHDSICEASVEEAEELFSEIARSESN